MVALDNLELVRRYNSYPKPPSINTLKLLFTLFIALSLANRSKKDIFTRNNLKNQIDTRESSTHK